MTKNLRILLAWISGLFLGIRLPGIFQIYQQDEYKWAQIVKPSYGLWNTLPHPPFAKWMYALWGVLVNYNSLRFVPLFFALASLWIGFMLVRKWYGDRTALLFGVLSSVSAASVLASLQIDIDGSFLPFWILVAFWGAHELWEGDKKKGKWVLALAVIGGMLTKLSFTLVLVALAVEWILRSGWRPTKKQAGIVASAIIVALLAWLSPFANSLLVVRYAKGFGFLNFGSRDYFELLLLTLKSIVLLGPMACVALVVGLRNVKRYRLLLIHVVIQILFYFVVFDFTARTLERYLLVLVFPVCAIAADAFASAWEDLTKPTKRSLGWTALLVAATLAIFLIPKAAIPLHPKEDFVAHVTHGDLQFLIPITGGSGPIGFYIPADVTLFLFLLTWIGAWHLIVRRVSWMAVPVFVVVVCSALLVSAEYTHGFLYGNASAVAERAITFVNERADIPNVITYNDIGGWELGESGKYFKRFYLNPVFADVLKSKVSSYNGAYLVVRMPPISSDHWISKYFEECKTLYHDQDRKVIADVYDCRGVGQPNF